MWLTNSWFELLVLIINIIGVLKGVHLGLFGKSHVPFLTTVTPSESGAKCLSVGTQIASWSWSRSYTNNCIVPDEPTDSEIAAGNM